jgi:hypothetical protein
MMFNDIDDFGIFLKKNYHREKVHLINRNDLQKIILYGYIVIDKYTHENCYKVFTPNNLIKWSEQDFLLWENVEQYISKYFPSIFRKNKIENILNSFKQ